MATKVGLFFKLTESPMFLKCLFTIFLIELSELPLDLVSCLTAAEVPATVATAAAGPVPRTAEPPELALVEPLVFTPVPSDPSEFSSSIY